MYTVSARSDRPATKFGNSERAAARELWEAAPRDWEPATVERYLADLIEEHGTAAHVATVEDARLLNAVLMPGPGLAACEGCRAIFSVRRRRATACPSCVRESADQKLAARRRGGLAWWLDPPVERCLGCDEQVRLGQLYCSDRCRMRVKRYVAAGGSIEAPRAGYPGGIVRLG